MGMFGCECTVRLRNTGCIVIAAESDWRDEAKKCPEEVYAAIGRLKDSIAGNPDLQVVCPVDYPVLGNAPSVPGGNEVR